MYMMCLEQNVCVQTVKLRKDRYVYFQLVTWTRQVTRATHARDRVCPWVELILKIIIILLIIFLGYTKIKPC